MRPWQKVVVNIVVSTCKASCIIIIIKTKDILTRSVSTLGLSLVSGFGGLLGFYIPGYVAVGKGYADITRLMTYPTLFM